MPEKSVLILIHEQALWRALDSLIGSADLGCKVLIAETLQHAEKTLRESEPGLLILDYAASREGTEDLLALVRKRGWRSLALVESMRDLARMQLAGVDVALVKGFPAGELLETIEALFETRIR